MAKVLVTGGTGMLGRRLVPALVERGHEVRVLTRNVTTDGAAAQLMHGDVVTGLGIDQAAAGVDAVIHAATSPTRRARKTEVVGTRTMLEAAARAGAHFVYVSIVGVNLNRLPYYKAKLEAEQLVESIGSRWTIQRATQFHDLLEKFLSYPIFFKAPALAFQLVDAGEVSVRLAEVIEAGPSGRTPDFGGPEVLGIEEIAKTRREITGRRARLLRVPAVGPVRDFARGANLCPEHNDGHVTWSQWLRESTNSG